jgi:hypothetical protein
MGLTPPPALSWSRSFRHVLSVIWQTEPLPFCADCMASATAMPLRFVQICSGCKPMVSPAPNR